jgi:hypothetical protein
MVIYPYLVTVAASDADKCRDLAPQIQLRAKLDHFLDLSETGPWEFG